MSCMQDAHLVTPQQICFKFLDNKGIYCVLKTFFSICVLFSAKCHLLRTLSFLVYMIFTFFYKGSTKFIYFPHCADTVISV
jgi:hypothetical protein